MESFDNIDNQTIERFYNNYLQSHGDKKYRFVNLGVWTINIKERLKMLTADKTNSEMHRMVIRGSSHKRPRPQNSRFGGGSITASLSQRGIKAKEWYNEYNWIGKTWAE